MDLKIHYPLSVSTVLLQASVIIIVHILKIINFIYIFYSGYKTYYFYNVNYLNINKSMFIHFQHYKWCPAFARATMLVSVTITCGATAVMVWLTRLTWHTNLYTQAPLMERKLKVLSWDQIQMIKVVSWCFDQNCLPNGARPQIRSIHTH
jgi:hypothetical protein